jgi:hypothetical protein
MTEPVDESSLARRYGQVCRSVFQEATWDECEAQVRKHWEIIRGANSWERVRDAIREGWLDGPSARIPGDGILDG